MKINIECSKESENKTKLYVRYGMVFITLALFVYFWEVTLSVLLIIAFILVIVGVGVLLHFILDWVFTDKNYCKK